MATIASPIVTLGSLKHTERPRSRPRAARPETGSRAKHWLPSSTQYVFHLVCSLSPPQGLFCFYLVCSVILRHVISFIISYPILSYHILSHRFLLYRIVAYGVVCHFVVSCRIVSYRHISHLLSLFVVSCRIASQCTYRVATHCTTVVSHSVSHLTVCYHMVWLIFLSPLWVQIVMCFPFDCLTRFTGCRLCRRPLGFD